MEEKGPSRVTRDRSNTSVLKLVKLANGWPPQSPHADIATGLQGQSGGAGQTQSRNSYRIIRIRIKE